MKNKSHKLDLNTLENPHLGPAYVDLASRQN